MAEDKREPFDEIGPGDISDGRGIFNPRDQREAMLMIEMRTKVLTKAQELSTRAIVELDENNTKAHEGLAEKIDRNKDAVTDMFTDTLTSINERLDNQGKTFLQSKVFYFVLPVVLAIVGFLFVKVGMLDVMVQKHLVEILK